MSQPYYGPAVIFKCESSFIDESDHAMELTDVLRGGRQCDEDGVEIIMSRQACVEAADELDRLRTELARLKEQNALLTVQVQGLRDALEDLLEQFDPRNHQTYCECDPSVGYQCAACKFPSIPAVGAAHDALTALPQQVKSEDSRDAKALDRAEIMRLAKLSGFYVDQDNPTNEYGVTWYNGTVTTLQNFAAHVAAISAQETQG